MERHLDQTIGVTCYYIVVRSLRFSLRHKSDKTQSLFDWVPWLVAFIRFQILPRTCLSPSVFDFIMYMLRWRWLSNLCCKTAAFYVSVVVSKNELDFNAFLLTSACRSAPVKSRKSMQLESKSSVNTQNGWSWKMRSWKIFSSNWPRTKPRATLWRWQKSFGKPRNGW